MEMEHELVVRSTPSEGRPTWRPDSPRCSSASTLVLGSLCRCWAHFWGSCRDMGAETANVQRQIMVFLAVAQMMNPDCHHHPYRLQHRYQSDRHCQFHHHHFRHQHHPILNIIIPTTRCIA